MIPDCHNRADAYTYTYIQTLTVTAVDNFLRADTKHKGSWKNAFLETLNYVYKEAPFFGCTGIVKPPFYVWCHLD